MDNILLITRKFLISIVLAVLYEYPKFQTSFLTITYAITFIFFIKINKITDWRTKMVAFIDLITLANSIIFTIGVFYEEASLKFSVSQAFIIFLIIIISCYYFASTI